MSDAASNTSDHLDLIWGAEAIAEALNLKTTRQAVWFLENGHIPCRKIGRRWVTAGSAALTALMNVGPGFGQVIGPAGNFSTLPDTAKAILCLAMLLGRLEYMALLILFTPAFWRW